jgi:uncharacterized protein (DUF2225 family)
MTDEIQCPLCGFRFSAKEAKACSGCPLGRGKCQKVICCPHCGYGFVEESSLVEWVKRIWNRFHHKA